MFKKRNKMFSKSDNMFSMNDVMFGRPRKKRRWLRNTAIVLGVILVLFLAGVLILTRFGTATITSPEENQEVDEKFKLVSIVDSDNPYFEDFSGRQKINVLLAGINTGLTDTIMLASFDVDEKRVDIVSIPRDTYYPREGFDGPASKKINAAYRGDISNTAKAVSELLMDIPIHYYAVVEFEGIENIVDAMGGVPVNVPFHMHYEDRWDTPPLIIDIPEGAQVLDGETAVKYLRFRKASTGYESYPMSDMDRQKAQEEFLRAAFSQSMGPNFLKVARSAYDNVVTNVDWATASKIAAKAMGMSGSDIQTYALPGKADVESPYYFRPDAEGIEELVKDIYEIHEEEEE